MAKADKDQKLIEKAVEFIAGHEKFSGKAYKDRTQFSFGYGTKAPHENATITREQARKKLEKVAASHFAEVSKIKGITDNQKVALTSLRYNIGGGAFDKSSLKGELNRGNHKAAAEEFGNWVYQSGKKLKGLEKRRQAERDIFLSETEEEDGE